MATYNIYGIGAALADAEVEVFDAFLASAQIDKGVMMLVDQQRQTELLKLEGLNAFEADAGIFDCGNKQAFLSANLALGMRDPDTRQFIKELIEKSGR